MPVPIALGQGGTWPGTRSYRPLWMKWFNFGDAGRRYRSRHAAARGRDRAVGLLVLPGDGGQQAAGGQARGVEGADAGGRLAPSGAVADAGAAGLVVAGPGRRGDFLTDPDRRQPDLEGDVAGRAASAVNRARGAAKICRSGAADWPPARLLARCRIG